MVFCNQHKKALNTPKKHVTILILIDGFLQSLHEQKIRKHMGCHNPYFNRWFSAITIDYIDNRGYKQSQSLF